MVIWIGVDDTDSLRGMCTTFLATELIHELTHKNDLIGFPRLVRLNPNIPWKTRGNGAICLRIGRGRGRPWRVGQIREEEVLAYPQTERLTDLDSTADLVAGVVEKWAAFSDPSTHPGFVVLKRQPSPRLYWRAVRDVVPIAEARRAVQSLGLVRTYKSGRGIVGASAAVAWRPRDRTYEVMAYRNPDRWGTKREIVPASVIEVDRAYSSTFNNFDYENNRVVIAPHSPCPVLCGIRGNDAEVLPAALGRLRGETPERWLVFETNQGTDDHVFPRADPLPTRTVRIRGSVTQAPRSIQGGHVVFQVDGFDVCAYEPSKQLRGIVRQLLVEDRVEVIGAVRETPRTLNLEKLRVIHTVQPTGRWTNPECSACGIRMKSMGRDAPFRCRRCRRRAPRSFAILVPVRRDLRAGWYEPPVGARRHLMKPLQRVFSTRHSLQDAEVTDAQAPERVVTAASTPKPGIR